MPLTTLQDTTAFPVPARFGPITSVYCVPPTTKFTRSEQLESELVMVNQLTVFVVAPVGSKQRLITRAGKTYVPVGPEPLRRVSVRLTQRLVEFSKCTLQSELL